MQTRHFTPTPSPSRSRRSVLAAGLALLAAGRPALPQEGEWPKLDVPYVPTPQKVVEGMLNLGRVAKADTVYDLGCGDGRVVITAARRRGARGVGIDIDPVRIREARENAARARVTHLVEFREANLFNTDYSPATVVTLSIRPEHKRA